jgi:antiviral helicase SKI2
MIMESLPTAIERLHLADIAQASENDAWIDSVLDEHRPLKRKRKTKEQVKADLEKDFLTPPTSLDTQWLNQLQQRWEAPTRYTDLFAIAPTQTRTIIRFTREGLEGRVTGYKEITVPASSATAKNSTSMFLPPLPTLFIWSRNSNVCLVFASRLRGPTLSAVPLDSFHSRQAA